MPHTIVGILALFSRLVSTVAELVCVSIAYVSGGKQARIVQAEADVRSPVSIEGGVGDD